MGALMDTYGGGYSVLRMVLYAHTLVPNYHETG
jgi:hypothetical protein